MSQHLTNIKSDTFIMNIIVFIIRRFFSSLTDKTFILTVYCIYIFGEFGVETLPKFGTFLTNLVDFPIMPSRLIKQTKFVHNNQI